MQGSEDKSANLCVGCNLKFRFSAPKPSPSDKGIGNLRGLPSKIPKILHCGHTVCDSCLQNGLKSSPLYRCPICDRSNEYPDIEKVPTNYNILGRVMLDKSKCNPSINFSTFMINGENAPCPKHPGESMTLNCLDCHNIQICDTCFEENHKGHFCDPIEYPESENPVKELIELKSVELEEMLRKTTKRFDIQHSLLQILEDQRIKEIAQVYEDKFKAIDFRKPLNRTCMDELRQKTWVKVNIPSYVQTTNSRYATVETEKEIIPRIINIRYEDDLSKEMKRVKLAENRNNDILDGEEVKLIENGKSTPSNFYVHRIKDLEAIKELQSAINQKFNLNALTTLESSYGLVAGDKVLIHRRKKNIRFEGSEQILRAEVLEANEDAVTVSLLDYGEQFECERMKTVFYHADPEFFDDKKYPIFAIRCELFNVIPATDPSIEEIEKTSSDSEIEAQEEWSETGACQFNQLNDRKLYARVVEERNFKTVVDLYMNKTYDSQLSWVSDHLVFMGNARYASGTSRHISCGNTEKYQYSELDDMDVGSVHQVMLTAFGGKDEDCTNDHGEPNFESLWFQLVRSGETKKDEKSYNAKIEILLRELKKYYKINENDANLLIDCPRIGQPCAVQCKRIKTPGAQGRDKAEERPEYYRGIIVDKKPGKPSLLDESLRSDDSEIKNLHPLVQVFFVDSGDKIWVNLNEVRMLPKWCMHVPKLAIKATLSDIVIERNLSLEQFDGICKTDCLWMSIDAKVDDQNKKPIKVVLFEELPYKRININALMVWYGYATYIDNESPSCRRVEYFKDDPLKILLKEGNKKIPVHSNANVTGANEFHESNLLSVTGVRNVIKGKTGHLIIIVDLVHKNPYTIQDLEEEMKKDFVAIDLKESKKFFHQKEQDDSDMVEMKIGQLCVWQEVSENLFRRARICELSEDGKEVKSVLCIDSGQIVEVKKEDKIRPLYTKFWSEFEQISISYKLKDVEVSDGTQCNRFLEAFRELSKGGMPVYLLRKTVNKTEFQVKGNIANVDLSRWEEEILEADLICQIPCDMGPFTEGKKYYFDVGILLSEMNVCRSTRIQAMLPVSDWQNSAKLRWLDPVIPSETEFFKLRRIGSPTVIRDFEATITNVENDGHIYLQDPNIGLGSLSSLNQQMEAVYLLSKPKWQDLDWYIGEACIAQFYYDDLWHRAEVIEFLNNLTLDTVPYQKQQEIRRESLFAMVRFVDYGNVCAVRRDQLRKDLVGLDTPKLSFPVKLHGIKMTSNFRAYDVYNQFQNTKVTVELKCPPTQQPLEVMLHLERRCIDLATVLVKQNMAVRV